MSELQKDDLSNILKNYLSHIVYIDDDFKITWTLPQEQTFKKPSRSSRQFGTNIGEIDDKGRKERSDLEKFCEVVQVYYPKVLLTPILYSSYTNNNQLSLHMKNARLLILDWSLTDRMTAIKLLNEVGFSGQLRFCVIYTSRLKDAKKEFIDGIPGVKEQGLAADKYAGKEYEYIRVDSTIYMICEKDKFDFDMIIGAFTDVFINEIGYFPIAFIDMISGLEQKVPYYLNKFAQPFDKLLLLQTNADGLPLDEVYHTISDMVINNIKADINLNESVLKRIYHKQINALSELLKDDSLFDEKLRKTLDVIIENLECDDKLKDAIKKTPVEVYKKIVSKAIKTPDTLYKSIENAGEYMAKCCADYLAINLLQGVEGSEKYDEAIKREISIMYKHQYKDKIKKMLPAFLIILLDPEQDYEINSLITSLKTVSYDEKEQSFSEIFLDCYDEDGEELLLKCDPQGHSKLSLLQNKLNPGDILFKKETMDAEPTAYLCIVPSCHMLRPKKVDGKILFIKGTIIDRYPEQLLRDSEHFTILPSINDNQPVNIIWQYHNVISINMNRMPKEDFLSYYRPYRLTYEYTRQIVGEFIAFYSKSGVEELFLKSDISLHQLLTPKKVELHE